MPNEEVPSMQAPPQPQMMQAPQGHMVQGGHLYIQTNEARNCVIHYDRAPDGTITEAGRIFTGSAGSGTYKPVSDQESAPNAFEGANSVILTPDRRFLFATNGGDNSVSSFAVGVEGKLTLLDAKRTGNVVDGRSGTAKALVYSPAHKMLYVLHAFGPDHLRLMSVDDEGTLTPRPEGYTVNLPDKPSRVATMAALTADEKFLVVGTTFDEPAKPYPDGSPILWVQKNGALHSIASNAPDPDGLIVFPVGAHGTLGEARFQDGGGGSPWNIQFLRSRPDHFLLGYAVGDGVAMGRIDEDGKVELGTLKVRNTGDRPVQVGSHFHFFEVNRALEFDREKAFGHRLDIASGTAVRFEPGDEREVTLVPFGGKRRVHGFNNLVDGWAPVNDGYRPQAARAVRLAAEYGFKTERQAGRSRAR